MPELTTIQEIAIWIIPVLLAITIHEAAHAYAANYFGDNTARMQGRLSLNPLRHIDLIGTIIVPLVILIGSHFNFVFGWAKPVSINYSQLRNPRRDMMLSTAAGPLSNFIMAIIWACLLKVAALLNPNTSTAAMFLLLTARAGILINLLLAWLNLIPIPPLDGSKIVAGLLPPRRAYYYQKIEPYGFFIVLGLLLTGLLSAILNPLLSGSMRVLLALVRL